jgi:hypothetical protein
VRFRQQLRLDNKPKNKDLPSVINHRLGRSARYEKKHIPTARVRSTSKSNCDSFFNYSFDTRPYDLLQLSSTQQLIEIGRHSQSVHTTCRDKERDLVEAYFPQTFLIKNALAPKMQQKPTTAIMMNPANQPSVS